MANTSFFAATTDGQLQALEALLEDGGKVDHIHDEDDGEAATQRSQGTKRFKRPEGEP